MPLNFLMMKSKGEGSSKGADLEPYSGKRTPGDLNEGEGSQVRDPKKIKMESPPTSRVSLGHYNILQPGENWTSREDIPVEVFDGFKLGGDAKFYDGLTRGKITSRCLKGMGQALSDSVRIVDGFGSGGGGDEVVNLRKALEQSEKEKAVLREELSSLVHKSMNDSFAMKLQLVQAKKDIANTWEHVEFVHDLYRMHTDARSRLEKEFINEYVDKANMWEHVVFIQNLYQKHTNARLRLENEFVNEFDAVRVLQLEKQNVFLKAEIEELKALTAMQVLERAKDDTTNTFKEHFPA